MKTTANSPMSQYECLLNSKQCQEQDSWFQELHVINSQLKGILPETPNDIDENAARDNNKVCIVDIENKWIQDKRNDVSVGDERVYGIKRMVVDECLRTERTSLLILFDFSSSPPFVTQIQFCRFAEVILN